MSVYMSSVLLTLEESLATMRANFVFCFDVNLFNMSFSFAWSSKHHITLLTLESFLHMVTVLMILSQHIICENFRTLRAKVLNARMIVKNVPLESVLILVSFLVIAMGTVKPIKLRLSVRPYVCLKTCFVFKLFAAYLTIETCF